jgi:uncharacterized protein
VESERETARLRIIVSEKATVHGKSLHTLLVQEALKQGLAGATVVHGVEGFGADRRLHTARLVDIAPALPMIIEIVDDESKLRAFLQAVESMIEAGMATLDRVTLLMHRPEGPTR